MSNYCKYYKQKKQKSLDGGLTWADVYEDGSLVYRQGDVYENCSYDCGYPIGKMWLAVSGEYICENFNKYQKEAEYVIYTPIGEPGEWYRTIKERIGEIIEEDAASCLKFKGTYPDGKIDRKSCNSSSTLSINDIIPSWSSGGESDMEKAEIGDCVTKIDDDTFLGCISLSSVTIPDSVTWIGNRAFYSCDLTSVSISSGVTWIGDYAFSGNKRLTNFIIPPRVSFINYGTFRNCENLSSITIPNGILTIDDYAFLGCISLSSVTIPNSVTFIGEYTFNSCSGLTSVAIPDSVTYFGRNSFEYCTNLNSVTIGSGVTAISDYAFRWCGSLSSVTIHDSVTRIRNYAFEHCTSLSSVTIPDSVTRIDSGAFFSCGLTSITIPSGVTSIGGSAFAFCESLSAVTIPDNVVSVDKSAFAGCTGLETITIGTGVTSIGDAAFQYCGSLTAITVNAVTPPTLGNSVFYNTGDCPICVPCESVNAYKSVWWQVDERITCRKKFEARYSGGTSYTGYCDSSTTLTQSEVRPSGYEYSAMTSAVINGICVTSIGDGAFSGCSSLTSVTIPDSVTSIGDYAFRGCSSLSSVTIPNSVTSIGDNAFYFCGLTSITIPSGITSIGDYTFGGCRSLSSVRIPDSVTSIGSNAFYYCSSLSSITIPDSVTYIGNAAFNFCYSLNLVIIGSGITSIGRNVFYSCDRLNFIKFLGTTPPTIDSGVFENTNNCPIYVPCESVNAYKSASGWSRYADRITCGAKFQATYSGGQTYSVECNSSTTLTRSEVRPSGYQSSAMTSAIIGNCVDTISGETFRFYDSLSSVTIPDSVTYIGSAAFEYCDSLTSVTIPDSVTTIQTFAFYGCSGLTSVNIGSGITYIAYEAFYNCRNLSSITINATTPPTIDSDVFTYTNNCPIYVPAASVNAYKSASVWSSYASRIQAIP